MDYKKDFSKIGMIMFLGTVIIFAVQFGSGLIVEKVPAIMESSDLQALSYMLPMYLVGFTAIFWMFKKVPAEPVPEKKKMRAIHVFAAFLMCYAGVNILNIGLSIPVTIISFLISDPSQNLASNVVNSVGPLTNLFIYVICAPILEELLFRKVIIDRTVKYGECVAIVVSSIMFGLFHGNIVQSCYVLILGFFTGLLYVKTRNIKYSIVIHMMLNFMGGFAQPFVLKISNEAMDRLSESLFSATGADVTPAIVCDIGIALLLFVYAFCMIGFLIAGIVLFCVNVRKMKLTKGEVVIKKGKRFSTIFLNAGMLLYSIFWIGMIIYRFV